MGFEDDESFFTSVGSLRAPFHSIARSLTIMCTTRSTPSGTSPNADNALESGPITLPFMIIPKWFAPGGFTAVVFVFDVSSPPSPAAVSSSPPPPRVNHSASYNARFKSSTVPASPSSVTGPISAPSCHRHRTLSVPTPFSPHEGVAAAVVVVVAVAVVPSKASIPPNQSINLLVTRVINRNRFQRAPHVVPSATFVHRNPRARTPNTARVSLPSRSTRFAYATDDRGASSSSSSSSSSSLRTNAIKHRLSYWLDYYVCYVCYLVSYLSDEIPMMMMVYDIVAVNVATTFSASHANAPPTASNAREHGESHGSHARRATHRTCRRAKTRYVASFSRVKRVGMTGAVGEEVLF